MTDADPRARLVDAGLDLIDQLPLPAVFAGATTAKVAAAAGVTTGSFFHHFANRADFVDALVLSALPDGDDLTEQVEDMVDALPHIDLIEVMRLSLRDTWEVNTTEESMRRGLRLQYELWAHHDQALSAPHGTLHSVGDVLRESYRRRHVDAVAGWNLLLDSVGRTFIDPFDMDRIAIALTALFEGLLARQQVDPDAVDDMLFSDISTALAAALTVPRGSRARLADMGTLMNDEMGLSPQARSGAKRRRATRLRITDAATDVLAQGWETVPASEVADAAGVSNQTVFNLFDGVREVAATTFVRHMAALRQVVRATSQDEPLVALYRVLTRLSELVAMDPEPARALLVERVTSSLHHGGDLTDMDIRLEVPLAAMVLPALERLDLDGDEPVQVASTLINFVLVQTLDRVGPAADVAALAVRLVPPSATGLTTWAPPGLGLHPDDGARVT